ncbi:MAG: DUF4381 domain-containing protein [Halioglobus sp.]
MKAPALPDIFGNYVLGEFVEVTPPPPISALPQTVGWAFVATAVLLGLAFYGWKKCRHWYRNRYRREALQVLQGLTSSKQVNAIELNTLLKRVALAGYPRQQVASLAGSQWACFLEKQCAEETFNAEQLEILGSRSYQPTSIDPVQLVHLSAAVALWITTHRGVQNA